MCRDALPAFAPHGRANLSPGLLSPLIGVFSDVMVSLYRAVVVVSMQLVGRDGVHLAS
jgi:hypothetical protein